MARSTSAHPGRFPGAAGPGCRTPDHYPENKGRIAKRAFFLVDREGIVRGRWMGEDLGTFPTEVLLKAARDMVGR